MRTLERLGTMWPDMLRFETLPRMLDLTDIRVEEFREDDGKTLVVRAELPGMDPDKDIEITVTDHMLRLRAQRQEETHDVDTGWRHSEFRYGSFERNLQLPRGASPDDVKAVYKDGILEMRVPVVTDDEEMTTRIKVTRK